MTFLPSAILRTPMRQSAAIKALDTQIRSAKNQLDSARSDFANQVAALRLTVDVAAARLETLEIVRESFATAAARTPRKPKVSKAPKQNQITAAVTNG